jgi:hypothetical protein
VYNSVVVYLSQGRLIVESGHLQLSQHNINTMSPTILKVLAFCLSQTMIIQGFRLLSRASSTALKSKAVMGAAEYSMPDQQARFAKAKAEGLFIISI